MFEIGREEAVEPCGTADRLGVAVAWPLTCDRPLTERAVARGGARPRIVFRTAVNDTLPSMV